MDFPTILPPRQQLALTAIPTETTDHIKIFLVSVGGASELFLLTLDKR
jgi:hypothetical protein